MKLFKVFTALALIVLGLSHSADAAFIVTIDIGNDGSVENTATDAVSPFNIGPLVAVSGTTTVTVSSLGFETASLSQINTSQAQIQISGTGSGVVSIKVLYEDLLLPAGDPLDVTATMSSDTPSGGITGGANMTYVNDNITLNTGTGAVSGESDPVTAAIGASPTATVTVNDLRDREGATFDLLQDLLINWDLTTASGPVGQAIATSQVREVVIPEATSLVAWSLCAAFGAIVAYRRRRIR